MEPEPLKEMNADILSTIDIRRDNDTLADNSLRRRLATIEFSRNSDDIDLKELEIELLYEAFASRNSDISFSASSMFSDKYWSVIENKRSRDDYVAESAEEYALYLSGQQPKNVPNEFFDEVRNDVHVFPNEIYATWFFSDRVKVYRTGRPKVETIFSSKYKKQ